MHSYSGICLITNYKPLSTPPFQVDFKVTNLACLIMQAALAQSLVKGFKNQTFFVNNHSLTNSELELCFKYMFNIILVVLFFMCMNLHNNLVIYLQYSV